MQELKTLGNSVARAVTALGFKKDGKGMSHRQGLDVVAKTGGRKNWQAVAALKQGGQQQADQGVVTMDPRVVNGTVQHDGTDYTLAPEATSCWITVDGFAVHIIRTGEGVVADVHAHRSWSIDAIASTYAFHTDAEADLCGSMGITIDDVAEWVGLHYKVNFDAEAPAKRHDWILRYSEAHNAKTGYGDLSNENTEPCIRVEYDTAYTGGNYDGVGLFAYIPSSLVDAFAKEPTYVNARHDELVDAAFRKHMHMDSIHIVHYSSDEHYTKDGKLIEN